MKNRVITISREFGSGGRAIGEILSKKLGIKLYDKTLVDLIAKESTFSQEYIQANDQKISSSLLFQIAITGSLPPWFNDFTEQLPNQTLFDAQKKAIQDLAEKESCIIIGRCAEYILEDRKDCLSVFIYGSEEEKSKRCTTQYGIPPGFTFAEMKKRDKERADYFTHHTGRPWGEAKNYHLSISSDKFSLEEVADIIINSAELGRE